MSTVISYPKSAFLVKSKQLNMRRLQFFLKSIQGLFFCGKILP